MIAKCNACQAEIIWAVTIRGARIPVDAEPVSHGGSILLEKFEYSAVTLAKLAPDGHGTHTSHFVTCPRSGVRR